MIEKYLHEVCQICAKLDQDEIQKMLEELKKIKQRGRLFILGVGGSAANASHAVNDFRKIAHMEAYAPTDNVAELTARTNDDGWNKIFVDWLSRSRINNKDAVLILSVGGGNVEKNVSVNLAEAIFLAKKAQAKVLGIVSRDGGETKKYADVCVLIPVVNNDNITPHAESFQAVIWHYLANNI